MKLCAAIQSIVLVFVFAYAANSVASGVNPEIETCIRKNTPKATVIEKIKLTAENDQVDMRFEDGQTLSVKVYWKHSPAGTSNMLAVFDEPDDILGSRLLFLEKTSGNEIYLYMPALFMVRRITSDRISSSMYGMDFSYEDFQFVYNMMATIASEQQPDAMIDGEPMYVFAVTPGKGEKSLYEKIYSYFDKKSCVIRKVEFYEQNGTLRKVIETDPGSIKKVNGLLVPHQFQMRDIKKGTKTKLTVISVDIDPPIDDSFFEPAKLKEHRGLN